VNSAHINDFYISNASGSHDQNSELQKGLNLPYTENLDTEDLLPITVTNIDNPDSGFIFMANYPNFIDRYKPALLMLNDTGKIIKYFEMDNKPFDFKVQSNCIITYMKADSKFGNKAFVMNSDFKIIDSLHCQNNYKTNNHDYIILPNGHSILFGYDQRRVDMSKIISKGFTNALVTGDIIQELDKDKKLVFQWSTWDYLKLTDSYTDLLAKNIDPFHINSVCSDFEGNLIVSFRNSSQIIKINHNDGSIIWRLGGRNNEFTFIGEHDENFPQYFSFQHDARLLPNGNLTLFDNGITHNPEYSKAVEYKIDEVNKTATLVWEYRHNPDIFTSTMGNVQRLSNGNTFICWSSATYDDYAFATEVHPDNSMALEINIPNNHTSYRAYKDYLHKCSSIAKVIRKNVLNNVRYKFNDGDNNTGLDLIFKVLYADIENEISVERFDCQPNIPNFDTIPKFVMPYRLELNFSKIHSFNGDFSIDLFKYPLIKYPEKIKIYASDKNNIFHELKTKYDSLEKKLIFSLTSGCTIIFGIPQEKSLHVKPRLTMPENDAVLNVNEVNIFKWSNSGYFIRNDIRIARDENFDKIVINTTVDNSDFAEINPILEADTYYWSVRTKNDFGWGDWSDTRKFKLTNPCIVLLCPNGGECWEKDSSIKYIEWKKNIDDTVRIELFRNDTFYRLIDDSLFCHTNSFAWTIPEDIQEDSTYRIKILSIKDSSIKDESTNQFSIRISTTGIKQKSEDRSQNSEVRLEQNFPNPVENTTQFKFAISQNSEFRIQNSEFRGYDIEITIYNILGEIIYNFADKYYEPGTYFVEWDCKDAPAGQYFCRLRVGLNFDVIKFSVIK
jgi:hypothetical protein